MILTTQREIQVWTYLKANRKRLRPVVEARCRNDGRLLAAVYPLRDEFWVWHLGERYSPEQWRVEVAIMTEDLVLEEEPAATDDGDASRSSDPPVDYSARNFPDALFQLHDPVGAYKAHTLEQILTAYPGGPYSSCAKCRSTYVIDYLAVSYATGEYVANKRRKRNIIYASRVSYCGDWGHNCDDHMTGEIPWNLAEACRIGKGMLSSHRKEEYL